MIQMFVREGQPRENLAHADQLLAHTCGNHPVDIAVLPECMDLGWGNPIALQEACPIPGPISDAIQALAAKYGVYIVAGITEKAEEGVYNSAILCDSHGNLLARHRKINLVMHLEDLYQVGNQLTVSDTPFGKIGVDICADNFPDNLAIGHALARMGAQMILSPCAWLVRPEFDHRKTAYGQMWHTAYRELSRLYDIPVIGVSHVGPVSTGKGAGRKAIGNSIAYGAGGTLLAELPFGENAETTQILSVPILPPIQRGTYLTRELERRGYRGI